MNRENIFAELEKKYGSKITFEGRDYYLIEQAYCDCPIGENYYQANAICSGDETDDCNSQDVYEIRWNTLPDFLAECEEDPYDWHDEGNACNWDFPDSVEKAGYGYNLIEKNIW